jgi:hypothetical protein
METSPPDVQSIKDNEHLKLLSIFHYIVGGLTIAFASIFIFHLVFISVLALHPEMFPSPKDHANPDFPKPLAYLFVAFISVFILTGWIIGILTIWSGRCIKHQKHRMFSMVMAGINCAFFPFGTALGVFSLLVLLRDSVKEIYKLSSKSSNPN